MNNTKTHDAHNAMVAADRSRMQKYGLLSGLRALDPATLQQIRDDAWHHRDMSAEGPALRRRFERMAQHHQALYIAGVRICILLAQDMVLSAGSEHAWHVTTQPDKHMLKAGILGVCAVASLCLHRASDGLTLTLTLQRNKHGSYVVNAELPHTDPQKSMNRAAALSLTGTALVSYFNRLKRFIPPAPPPKLRHIDAIARGLGWCKNATVAEMQQCGGLATVADWQQCGGLATVAEMQQCGGLATVAEMQQCGGVATVAHPPQGGDIKVVIRPGGAHGEVRCSLPDGPKHVKNMLVMIRLMQANPAAVAALFDALCDHIDENYEAAAENDGELTSLQRVVSAWSDLNDKSGQGVALFELLTEVDDA